MEATFVITDDEYTFDVIPGKTLEDYHSVILDGIEHRYICMGENRYWVEYDPATLEKFKWEYAQRHLSENADEKHVQELGKEIERYYLKLN